jgi:hypothetical protein
MPTIGADPSKEELAVRTLGRSPRAELVTRQTTSPLLIGASAT